METDSQENEEKKEEEKKEEKGSEEDKAEVRKNTSLLNDLSGEWVSGTFTPEIILMLYQWADHDWAIRKRGDWGEETGGGGRNWGANQRESLPGGGQTPD